MVPLDQYISICIAPQQAFLVLFA